MRLRFFNTFETVSPHFRQLLPHLGACGHEVEAVIARRQYRPEAEARRRPGVRTRAVPVWKRGDLRTRSGKLAVYATYASSAATLSLLGRAVDLNVFFTQPPLFPAWGRVLEILRRQPYVQIVMDLYPWLAIQAGALSQHGSASRVARAVARRALQDASRVVVIGRCMQERVAALGVDPTRIRLIRNWADCRAVRPVPRRENPLRKVLGLGDRFVVMYSGNMGLSHSFDEILEVAARSKGRADLRFLVVGGGARRAEVEAAVRERGLDNVRLLGFRPTEELSESLGTADVHYVSLRRGFEGLVVPSKTYAAMAAGRPVIYQGHPSGEIARMVEEERVGWVVPPGDTDALHEAILAAKADRDRLERTGNRARAVAEVRYDAERGLAEFRELLEELSTGEPR